MEMSFCTREELQALGLKKIGTNVLISKKASIYGAEKIIIGSNVRIDDFCILSGKVIIGNYVHIAAYSALYAGKTGITMKDFSGLSSRCVIYAESDDYSGNHLTNPTVGEKYLNIIKGEVVLNKHVIIGTGTCVMPFVEIGEGSAVGGMSLVNKSLDEWSIYAGIPCKKLRNRNRNILKEEQKFMMDQVGV